MVYDKICLMLPTYKRVDRLKEFITSAVDCADDVSKIQFIFCVNVNDKDTQAYVRDELNEFKISHEVVLESSQQPNLPMYYNTMYKLSPEDAVISMVGDDMVFKTKGYDTAILKAINEAEGKAIVYCNDDFIAGEKLCVNLFTTRLMVEATGKPFMCEMYHADMIDVVWTNVGLLTGTLKYLKDVIIKHEHESVKKNVKDFDETCKRMMPLRALANDKENRLYGWRYAHMCAANLIDAGIGKWGTL